MSVLSNIKVYGLEESIRASKYPMLTDIADATEDITDTTLKLGRAPAGSGEDQFLTGIIAQFDLTFSVKVWTEAERYHFFDFVSSQSTMHRINKFDLDQTYVPYVDKRVIEIMKEKIDAYNSFKINPDASVEDRIKQGEIKKNLYLEILYTNPAGFKLTARMTTNYRQLKTIYYQRRNHRLPEWREFCSQLLDFPEFENLCLNPTRKEML